MMNFYRVVSYFFKFKKKKLEIKIKMLNTHSKLLTHIRNIFIMQSIFL